MQNQEQFKHTSGIRVGINLFEFSPPAARGAGVLNYVKGLLSGFRRVDSQNSYFLFVSRLGIAEFSSPGPNFVLVVVPLDARKKWMRIIWEQFLLPIYVWKYRLDVLHCPSDSASIPLLGRCVVTSHATNLFFYRDRFPEYVNGYKQKYLQFMQRHVIPKARVIITVSNHSRNEIIRYLGAGPGRVRVIYHAPEGEALRESLFPERYLHFPYILSVTSSAVHKNLPMLFRAYSILKNRLIPIPKLVIVGFIPEKPAWAMHTRSELEDCIERLGLKGDILLMSFVERACLDSLYHGAELFVFPSLYEGFGLVVLEAMQRGVPTVISDRASLPEVGGQAAIYVNPDDEESIARGIELVLTNRTLRQQLVERAFQQVQVFGSWDRVARETLAIYREVAGNRHRVIASRESNNT